MCGIAGIVKLATDETVDEARLKRMRDVLRHRGPDGEGLFIDGPVGLAHRRLSIVDVAGGAQPMANEDQTVWITYNGEVYNHAALRPALEAKGHRYRTRSDTETILHLYEEEGERCVEQLQGMFAFAIWDAGRQRLVLARDRLGIKPLYYAETPEELLFASEIKAIVAAGSTSPTFNDAVLPEFLATRFVAGPETFFRGIRKLLPGRTLVWVPGQSPVTRRYWSLPREIDTEAGAMTTVAGELRQRLEEVVRSHLMSDVPLGVFLSGGIDSTGLAALMTRRLPSVLRSFSVGFQEREADELAYARLAARALGSEHREVVVSRTEFFRALPHLVWHEDEPIAFPSSVPLYFVSRLARDHVKVVLTGEGADELFLGYNRYRVTRWNHTLGRWWQAVMPATGRKAVDQAVRRAPFRVRRYAGRTFLALEASIRSAFYDNFAVFPEAVQARLLTRRRPSEVPDPYAEGLACYLAAPGGTLERLGYADLQTYLVELLMKQDQASMAASIESRVPFLDHRFVEYAAALPGRLKVRGWRTKAVLRAALADLVPAPILHRRKMGFPVPLGRWLGGPAEPIIDEFVLGPRAQARGLFERQELRRLVDLQCAGQVSPDRLWLLINLEVWQRIFLDGEEPSAIAELM